MAYLLATRSPCTRIQEDEIRIVKRTLVGLKRGQFPPKDRPKSWVLVVLICPGDTLEGVAEWVRRLPRRDRDRVYLYFHPRTDRVAALAPWHAAGLEDPVVSLAHDFKTFHKSFGARLNLQTYNDFRSE